MQKKLPYLAVAALVAFLLLTGTSGAYRNLSLGFGSSSSGEEESEGMPALGEQLAEEDDPGETPAGVLDDPQEEVADVTKPNDIKGPQPGEGNGSEDEKEKKYVENPADIMVLVNKEWNLPADYVPADLVAPDVAFSFSEDVPKRKLRREAAEALEELFAAALADDIHLVGVSGYRSYQTQDNIFSLRASQRGAEVANKTVAYPGQSEHQTGLAMDVSGASVNYQLVEGFAETPEGQWLAENAPAYGFIIRYQRGKEDITGYSYEPWHLRYVGVEAAVEVSGRGLTFEEYMSVKTEEE